MIRLRWATVARVERLTDARADLLCDLDGEQVRAVAYRALSAPVQQGARVLLNTTAVELGLGTGGVHLVVGTEADAAVGEGGHAVKLRYTPLQVAVDAVEEVHQPAIDAVASLEGLPVVAAGLHSAVPAVALGVRAVAPRARIAYVMTDGAALVMAFSDLVPAMREAGLLDIVITAGQATGGDLEAVNNYGALAACKAVARADVVIVAMGPGNLGTGSRWGFAALEVAAIANTTLGMGGRAIVAPRLSGSDARERHRGLSHHTATALDMTLGRAEIGVPGSRAELLQPWADKHVVRAVDDERLRAALEGSSVPLRSMGRSYDQDPLPFLGAAAAGIAAAEPS